LIGGRIEIRGDLVPFLAKGLGRKIERDCGARPGRAALIGNHGLMQDNPADEREKQYLA